MAVYTQVFTWKEMETSVLGSPWPRFKGSRATRGWRDCLDREDTLPSLQEALLDGAAAVWAATGWPEAGPFLGAVPPHPGLAHQRAPLRAWHTTGDPHLHPGLETFRDILDTTFVYLLSSDSESLRDSGGNDHGNG